MELRKLPRVDSVLARPELVSFQSVLGRAVLADLVRSVLEQWRERIREGEPAPGPDGVLQDVLAAAKRRSEPQLRRVINATGILIHTNLGRAPLPRASLDLIAETAGGYCTLEYSTETGSRARRGSELERELARLVGAESALLVNNNAAAVLLCLSALAAGREVIVSRGELVEIGGGFRIPEVLARSGARLVEVGTTNKTRVSDYAERIGAETACLLRVHPSNFRMVGFTERPTLEQLGQLARERGVPLVHDLGGGLLDACVVAGLEPLMAAEPRVDRSVQHADLVCFSLDKLFGGPQGGAIAGSAAAVDPLRRDPMARALRVDKLVIAALEPVVRAHAAGRSGDVPVHAMLRVPVEVLRRRAHSLRQRLGAAGDRTHVADHVAAVGGGTLAAAELPSCALVVACDDPDGFAAALRCARVPVIARVVEGRVWLDVRTIAPDEDDDLVTTLAQVLSRGPSE